MFQAIPVSQIVSATPSALAARVQTQSGAMHVATKSTQLAFGSFGGVTYMVSAPAQATATFGAGSPEEAIAIQYFQGMTNGDRLPSQLFFTPYAEVPLASWMAGAAMTSLSAVQALAGTFQVEIDGRTVTTSNINLSAATTYAQAAALIQTGLQNPAGIFQGTAAQTAGADTLDVTAVTSGELHIGDVLTGTGVDAGLTITAFGTGTGGVGTYIVSTTTGFASTTISVGSLATCTIDSVVPGEFVITSPTTGPNSIVNNPVDVSGSITSTLFAQPNISSGVAAQTPDQYMQQLWGVFQNFSTMALAWAPSSVAEATLWANAKNSVAPGIIFPIVDNVSSYATSTDLTGTLKQAVANIPNIPTYLDYTGILLPAALGACRASIDYNKTSAVSTTPAYKNFPGLQPQILSGAVAANLNANKVMYYGSWSNSSANPLSFMYGDWNSGPVSSIGAAYDQLALDNKAQADILNWLTIIKRFPYSAPGYAACRAVLIGSTIKWAKNNGIIQPGVVLSAQEANAIVAATGVSGAPSEVQTKGYYVFVADPGAAARTAGSSPTIIIFYTSGGRVLTLNVSTVNAQ